MVSAQRQFMARDAIVVGTSGTTALADRYLPEIVALTNWGFLKPGTRRVETPAHSCYNRGEELACDAGDVAKAYLNQHWIPGSPRRPALVQARPACRTASALKQAQGTHLFVGFRA